jgi:anti-anti-sigma factor
MDIREEMQGSVCVAIARGRLDASASAAFTERMEKLIVKSPRLLVDFAEVDFVSSAGLRAILSTTKKTKALGGVFALCAVQRPVLEVLDITGFTPMIEIHADRSTALAALG